MSTPQRIRSVLRLGRAAAMTKGTLRRWTERAWADANTVEHREVRDVLAKIAELDEAITAMCASYDKAQEVSR